MVAITAPAVRVALGEELGLSPGSVTTGQMVTAQRELGFDYGGQQHCVDLVAWKENRAHLRIRQLQGCCQRPVSHPSSPPSPPSPPPPALSPAPRSL